MPRSGLFYLFQCFIWPRQSTILFLYFFSSFILLCFIWPCIFFNYNLSLLYRNLIVQYFLAMESGHYCHNLSIIVYCFKIVFYRPWSFVFLINLQSNKCLLSFLHLLRFLCLIYRYTLFCVSLPALVQFLDMVTYLIFCVFISSFGFPPYFDWQWGSRECR